MVELRHGPMCTIMEIGGKVQCVGWHCSWCGEPTSMMGHDCEWKERREERPGTTEAAPVDPAVDSAADTDSTASRPPLGDSRLETAD